MHSLRTSFEEDMPTPGHVNDGTNGFAVKWLQAYDGRRDLATDPPKPFDGGPCWQ